MWLLEMRQRRLESRYAHSRIALELAPALASMTALAEQLKKTAASSIHDEQAAAELASASSAAAIAVSEVKRNLQTGGFSVSLKLEPIERAVATKRNFIDRMVWDAQADANSKSVTDPPAYDRLLAELCGDVQKLVAKLEGVKRKAERAAEGKFLVPDVGLGNGLGQAAATRQNATVAFGAICVAVLVMSIFMAPLFMHPQARTNHAPASSVERRGNVLSSTLQHLNPRLAYINAVYADVGGRPAQGKSSLVSEFAENIKEEIRASAQNRDELSTMKPDADETKYIRSMQNFFQTAMPGWHEKLSPEQLDIAIAGWCEWYLEGKVTLDGKSR